jgi:hypothetical protein
LIYTLLVAHFVADFLCQTDDMALKKSKDWGALGRHVIAYTVVLAIFAAGWYAATGRGLLPPEQQWFWPWVALNAAAHFVQDAITSRINGRLWFFAPEVQSAGNPVTWQGRQCWTVRGGNRHWFFVGIGFDQLLHYVTLFATAEWLLR